MRALIIPSVLTIVLIGCAASSGSGGTGRTEVTMERGGCQGRIHPERSDATEDHAACLGVRIAQSADYDSFSAFLVPTTLVGLR